MYLIQCLSQYCKISKYSNGNLLAPKKRWALNILCIFGIKIRVKIHVLHHILTKPPMLSNCYSFTVTKHAYKFISCAIKTQFITRAATILRLLGHETIQFNTRSKKSEPAIRKQLNIDVKSTTKLNFFL